jgi:hypothetical protein
VAWQFPPALKSKKRPSQLQKKPAWTPLSQGHHLPGAVLISDLLPLVLFDAIYGCDRYEQRPCTEPLFLVT